MLGAIRVRTPGLNGSGRVKKMHAQFAGTIILLEFDRKQQHKPHEAKLNKIKDRIPLRYVWVKHHTGRSKNEMERYLPALFILIGLCVRMYTIHITNK